MLSPVPTYVLLELTRISGILQNMCCQVSDSSYTPKRVVFLQGCVAHKHPVKREELLIEHASGGSVPAVFYFLSVFVETNCDGLRW